MITSSNVPKHNFVSWSETKKKREAIRLETQESLDMLNEGGVDYVEVDSETDGSEEDL